ncbi:PTS sugar transporter subunit IIA [Paucilactobacillus suebicus]|uniref:PTS EIIA type-2 domain-containing protein n=1 Tax=Paucilactobacillus suebicus DSM 5007 = KCTC 3549 TaxID=1423807 RepID=A0A0R1VTP5_9LACO|nr:PTS sugar transporter subunit IIA [Paucilactobacillus suebicus]KRM09063.1 hypothetical protein FD16_GL002045 [Paucilactobacillus suebicus DSM 5007 = KCTC 3549]
MNLVSSINPQNILVSIDDTDKKSVIAKLVDALYETGEITDKKEFIDDVYFREEEGITGIGNGLAIPHGRNEFVKNSSFAIATLKQSVEWGSIDDEPVKVVILLADSLDGKPIMLDKFMKKLSDEDKLHFLKEATSVSDVISVLDR